MRNANEVTSFFEDYFFAEPPETTQEGSMLYRKLGPTGERVSLIGVGGFHLGTAADDQEGVRIVRKAVDSGVTFMDNCWDYHEGVSEMRMGRALKNGYREKVFLMSKIDGRYKETAARQIDESLLRLQTDRVDLMQFHEVIRVEDPDLIFSQGGALEAVQEAQNQGKVRFIGFTGHKDPMIHLRMLDMAEKNGFRFDTVQMPLNLMDAHFRSFQNLVLPRLVREGIGVLGMKPMGAGLIPQSEAASPMECLHYAMTLPVSTVITGMENFSMLEQALTAARTFEPLTRDDLSDLLGRSSEAGRNGEYEPYKTATRHDATARNPRWLGGV
ncbi:MAG: aldo/keto reductase [Thermodesulfobacteriota bacterium]